MYGATHSQWCLPERKKKRWWCRWSYVQGNELGGGSLTIYTQELKLPQHASCHRELLPYADLMNWLKIVDHDSFAKLRKVTMLFCGQFCRHLPCGRGSFAGISWPIVKYRESVLNKYSKEKLNKHNKSTAEQNEPVLKSAHDGLCLSAYEK